MVSRGLRNIIRFMERNKEKSKTQTIEEQRDNLELLASLVKIPEDVKFERIDVEGIPAEWINTPGGSEQQVILYLHGRYYVSGSCNTHRDLASRISRASKACVLLIEYRLAPEHPFPEGLEDSIKAYNWLISNKNFTPKNIIIAGDSAGGGLTLATLLKLREMKKDLPVAAVCLSPWTDLAITGDSIRTKAEIDSFLTPERTEYCAKLYLGEEDPQNTFASPLYADLQGLPPLLIQVGTSEILLDDSVRLANRAKEAGVDVKLEIWDDMIHVFQAFAAVAPEGQDGINKIGEFIQKFFS